MIFKGDFDTHVLKKNPFLFFFMIVKGFVLHTYCGNFLCCGSWNILEASDFTASCS